MPICSSTRFDTKGVGGMSKNLRTYGKSESREICPAGASQGFLGEISTITVTCSAAIIALHFECAFRNRHLFFSSPLEAISKFATHNISYHFSLSLSLSLSIFSSAPFFRKPPLSLCWRSAKLIKLRRERRKWRTTVKRERERERGGEGE